MTPLAGKLLAWMYAHENFKATGTYGNLNAKLYADAIVELMQAGLVDLKGTLQCAHVQLTSEGRRQALLLDLGDDTLPGV